MAAERSSGSVQTLAATGMEAASLDCQQCGAPFTPRRRRRDARFCKPACRARWHAERRAARLVELEHTLARAATLVRELREGRAGQSDTD